MLAVACALCCTATATAQDQAGTPSDAGVIPSGDAGAPAAAASASPSVGEEDIVVTGLRRSVQGAQALKRDADQILDAVVAEDIGKLPDNNAAEALARITGVQVSRSQDEANGVSVRGLPDVTTTFNGRELYTAEGRQVAFQDFPAASLAGLEVYKATTADLVEGGIAGLVNVRSRRPFDFDGFEIAGSIRGIYGDQARKVDPQGSLLVTDRFDTPIGEFGALINVSYTQTNYLTSARWDSGDVDTPVEGQVITTPGVGRDFKIPESVGIFYNNGKRWRPSVNSSLQWRPADNIELYLEGLYQGYRSREENSELAIRLRNGNPTFSNVVLDADDPGKVTSLTRSGGEGSIGTDLFRGVPHSTTNTYQFAGGGSIKGEHAKFSTDLAYTDTRNYFTDYGFDFAARDPATADIAFDIDRDYGGVEFSLPGFDLTNPDNYVIRGIFDRRREGRGSGWQWRNDLELDFDLDGIDKLQFGTRYTTRKSTFADGTRYANIRAQRVPLTAAPIGMGGLVKEGFRGSDAQPTRQWYAPSGQDVFDNIEALRAFAQDRLRISNLGNADQQPELWDPALPPYTTQFAADEKSYAFYGQLHYGFELGGIPLDGVVGARVVNTTIETVGLGSVDGDVRITDDRKNYVDVLPNVSLRARLTDQLQFRASATETRTRPTFGQSNPAFVLQRDSVNLGDYNGSSGNIDLEPIQSKNYDASLEWYFSRTGSLTGAVFRRDLKGFISNYTVFQQVPGFGNIRVTRPENAGEGRIQGVELAFTSFFDFLPSVLSGLGTQLNATYLDGKQALPTVLGEQGRLVRVPNTSKWTYNANLLYEKGPVSARLAYNYRTDWVNFYNNTESESAVAGEYTRATARLDFSAAVTPVEFLTITFDATNLTGVPFQNVRNFSDTQSYPRDIRYEARTFSLGARFRF
ncbi:TonB-dependent receptor [Sphingomonas sp. RHCKR7]|uniref:TonB-dependent receptor n=1 Tax=Sphingomonas folli TaxID=2862497 RepID=UPI001CA5B751|nr:TonB-dependent receptor [Sphingomonas folli]MBW6526998.1 TonB-dependent receptor [Sphingomonas folli]